LEKSLFLITKITLFSGTMLPGACFEVMANRPGGPAALECEIRLSTHVFGKESVTLDTIKLIIAHELAHAFDLMRLSVPAVMNWNDFWNKPLARGTRCKQALLTIERWSQQLDDYGSQSELDCLRKYWPSYAEQWLQAGEELRAGM
jgi:hypothetical protein